MNGVGRRGIPDTARAGILLALAAAVVSGFAVYANSFAIKAAPGALSFTTAKNLVAFVIIGAVFLGSPARGQSRAVLRELRPGQWLGLAYVGLIGGGLAFALFFTGLAGSSAVQAAFVQKSLVLWVALLAVPVLHEKLTWRQGVAVALLVAGQLLLSGAFTLPRTSAAIGLVFAATLLWAAEIVIVRRLLRQVPVALLGTVRLGAGLLVLLGWLAASAGLGQLAALGAVWMWVIVTGVLLSGYVLTWFAALRRAQAVDVTAVLVLGAFITALLSLPSAAAVNVAQVCGLVLIAGGVGVIAVSGLRRRPVPG